MSTVKQLQFQETIHASPAIVWGILFGDDTYPVWTAPFSEGSYFEGSWEEGSRIRFLSPSGEGMVAEIAESRPHAFLSIRHLGFVANGVEDLESEAVRAWAPAYENYTLTPVPDGTRIVIDQDVTGDFEAYMNTTWPRALAVLKELCEARGAA